MMGFKSFIQVFAWSLAVIAISALAVVCLVQRQTLVTLREAERVQQEKLREVDRLRVENAQAQHLQDQAAELERLRENTKDLLRLRSEVTQLRQQVAELDKLRAANAELLQALQASRLQGDQLALVSEARSKGALLGIALRPANDPQNQAAGRNGVEILSLDPNSPVATSGLQPGDLIVALDGRPIQTPGQIQAEMLTRKPGETVLLDVIRTNTVLRFQVQTRAWPEPKR